jgi:hypothetical protein
MQSPTRRTGDPGHLANCCSIETPARSRLVIPMAPARIRRPSLGRRRKGTKHAVGLDEPRRERSPTTKPHFRTFLIARYDDAVDKEATSCLLPSG